MSDSPRTETQERIIGLNTCIHQHLQGGFCDDCTARMDAAKAGRCVNCRIRPATLDWIGEGGLLAYVHGMSERWCVHCATEAQLVHARKMAADIPDLERLLAENP